MDYAQTVESCNRTLAEPAQYSPPDCLGTKKTAIMGYPDQRQVSTAYAERDNLTHYPPLRAERRQRQQEHPQHGCPGGAGTALERQDLAWR